MKTSATLRLLSVLLLVGGVVFAQQGPTLQTPPPDKPAAKHAPSGQVGGLRFFDVSEVTIVNVDVAVSDKKGPVLDLKPEDFQVFQDGKLQPIANFALYTRQVGREPTPVPTAAPTAVPATPTPELAPPPKREPRFVAFYVDNENVLPFNRNRVITSITQWVRDYLQAPDQAMVVSYQRSLKVLQPFTSDPDEVASALQVMKRYTGGAADANSTRTRIEDYIDQNSNNPNSMMAALDQTRSFAREQYNNLTFTLGALRELIGMMSGLPGKKAIIYVSDGLPMTPGLELYYAIQDAFRNAQVLSESRDNDATDLFRSLVNTASSAGVTFYTIDSRGLQSNMGIEAERREPRSPLTAAMISNNYQDSLVFMAEQTGGIAILNANDPTAGLEKIANDFGTYYSLGYRLIPSGQDRAHYIQVKVKNHPEYRLAYRQRFIEKSLPTRVGDRVISGLAFDLEDNPLDIKLETGDPAPADNNRWTLPVAVHVPIAKIALVPDGDDLSGHIMVYYAARDTEGKQSDLQRLEHSIRVASSKYAAARTQYYTITANLLLEPGTYRISVGVRDELTNQAGYALARKAVHPEAE